MKTGSFTRFLRRNYPDEAFRQDGRISKTFVKSRIATWSPQIRSKARFFLNTVKR